MLRKASGPVVWLVLIGVALAPPAWSGPAPEGTAVATYYPTTGAFAISTNNVVTWALLSDGMFTGTDLDRVLDILPLGNDYNYVLANPNAVGEVGFSDVPLVYTDVYLGRITQAQLDVSNFSLDYVRTLGGDSMTGEITVSQTPILISAADGDWNDAATWGTASTIPTKDYMTEVGNHTITVAESGLALSLLTTGSEGRVEIAGGTTLGIIAGIEITAGTMQIGSGGRLVTGEITMSAGAEFAFGLGPESNGEVLVLDNVHLDGKLTFQPTAVATSELGKTISRTIIRSFSGVIDGNFSDVPAVHTGSPYPDRPRDAVDPSLPVAGHLGNGVFFRGVSYPDPGGPAQVDVDLFIAKPGDGNADGFIDAADISQLVSRFNSDPILPRNRFWFDMDTAGDPLTGRSDGYVDGADLSAMVAAWTGDPGPAREGTAVSSRGNAEYNPATGEFTVSVEGVMSWTLRSDGKFTGPGLDAVRDVLPLGAPSNLLSANLNTVGEGGFGAAMTYADVPLGALTEPGTDAAEFSIEYVTGYGQPILRGTVTVVPEPGAVAMLLSGLLGLAALLWRRRRRVA